MAVPTEIPASARDVRIARLLLGVTSQGENYVHLRDSADAARAPININFARLADNPDAKRSISHSLAADIVIANQHLSLLREAGINIVCGTRYGSRFSAEVAQILDLYPVTAYKGWEMDRERYEIPHNGERRIVLIDDWLSKASFVGDFARNVGRTLRGEVVGVYGIVGYHMPDRVATPDGRIIPVNTLTTVEAIIADEGFGAAFPQADGIRLQEKNFVRMR